MTGHAPLVEVPTPWRAHVGTVPRGDSPAPFFAEAVPALAACTARPAGAPLVVSVCLRYRTRHPATRAGTPMRAKTLLDALHDDRTHGPHYSDLGRPPILADDDPRYVCGLAVEVTDGDADRTAWSIGARFEPRGTLLLALDVDAEAPNDVSASPSEKARSASRRGLLASAVAGAWARAGSPPRPAGANLLIVRHRPQRDEDNTWQTWQGALAGSSAWSREAWRGASPFAGWVPQAFASEADADLPVATRYEIWRG